MNTHTSLNDTFSYIDQQRSTHLERLVDYLRHPSISAYGEGIEETALFLQQWLADMGFESQCLPTAGWPMVVGRRAAPAGKPTLLIYGHYDVQPPDPLEAWVSPPFEPTIRNGRLYARGVGDNKGQHFANLLGVESLLTCGGELPCGVVFLLEGEEEVGSPHMPDFVSQNRELLKADLVVVSDGPVHTSGRSVLEFGVRGVASFELRAHGANQDLHSGNWGGVPPNPLWTLIHLLESMKNARGEVTIDGFYEHVDPPDALVRAALDALPVDEEGIKRQIGLEAFDEPVERSFYDRLSVFPTFTINGLHGGYAGPGSKTVLPHEAFAKCDMRLVGSQTVNEILGKVEAHVKRHAPGVEFIRQGGMDPSSTPLDSPFANPLFEAITTAQGEEPLRMPAMGGSLPNYVFTRILGLPTFVVPYANADEANHAPNENMEVERFHKGIKTCAAMLSFLGSIQ